MEIGEHIDILDNDWIGHRQVVVGRFALGNGGIEMTADEQHQRLLGLWLGEEYTDDEVEVGKITSETSPEQWLNKTVQKLGDGSYIFATAIHGPDCPHGDIGTIIPMVPRKLS